MEQAGRSYSSGEWLVQAGSEEEFVDRWTAFVEWSSQNAAGAESFVLVRREDEPRRFLSLGAWEDQQAQEAWRAMPRMQELLGRCRDLCDEFESHSYALAASRGAPRSSTERVAGTVQEGVTASGRTASGLLGGRPAPWATSRVALWRPRPPVPSGRPRPWPSP